VCRLLQIKSELTQHLHNAGNDARCTHLVLKEMAGGDPLDMQRTSRWPQHTSTNGLRVKFSKEDEDSDAFLSDDDDDDITAGPYDPRTGRLREGWAERVAHLQERLDGIRSEQENPTEGGGNDQPVNTSASTQESQ